MFDKLKLPLAKSKKSKFNLRNHVIATGEMGQLFPIRQIEVVPDDDFTIDVEMFSRTAPLVVPTFGSVKFTTRAFYVPSRLLYPYWNEFITGKNIYVDGEPYTPEIPFIYGYELADFFIDTNFGLSEYVSTGSYDFSLRDRENIVKHFVFTNKGRYWLKVFHSLGYKFNFVSNYGTDVHKNEVKYSLLPLLSFLRVYMDYYLPSQFLETSRITQYFNQLRGVYDRIWFVTGLWQAITDIQLAYDNDYFTSAWRCPLSLMANSKEDTFINITDKGQQYENRAVSDNYAVVGATYSEKFNGESTNFAISLAQKLANYIIRNNYAGSRAVEQILARFGVRVPDMDIQRCIHFGTSQSNLEIMDVTNTAESEYAKLGSYGAKAIGFDNGNKMHIHCKEHGFIILMASIMPETSMGFQGFDRNLMHLDKFDFFTPEFDRSIMQPIYSGELLCNFMDSNTDDSNITYSDYESHNAKPTDIFGFVPYGTEYKVAHDNVIGDFNIPHLGQELDCYHLFREIIPDTNIIAQNQNLIYFNSDQYNRIFNVTDQNEDHFYMIYRIKVTAERPMMSISESIPFADDDIEHRNRVSMQPNGSKYNN